jgi:hypothetical protein
MTSLRASLPPPGSVNWSGSSGTTDRDPFCLELKVRHVVIRECILRQLPKPHTLYKVDVMTQSDQWAVYRQVNEWAAPFTLPSTTSCYLQHRSASLLPFSSN